MTCTTRLQALTTEIATLMQNLSILAETAENGTETQAEEAGAQGLALIAEIERLETEGTIERLRPAMS